MKRFAFVLLAALCFRCASNPPTVPPPQTESSPAGAPKPDAAVIGTVVVTGSTLNVRRQPSTAGEIVTQVKRGTKLTLVTVGNDWMQVLLPNGERGWVSSQYVERAGVAARTSRAPRRNGCAPDSDYSFVTPPVLAFSEGGAHGLVVVEANVDPAGKVSSTRVLSNTTGEETLGLLSEQEIRRARFAAPVRNCAARAFIFTYTRTF